MKVELTDDALDDLTDIALWVGRDSLSSGEQFSDDVRERCRELDKRAMLYPVAEGLEDDGIRRRLYRKYLIFYRVTAERVEVLRVIHGSRDWLPMLLSEE